MVKVTIRNSFRLGRFGILAFLLILGWVSAGMYKIFFKGERAADSFTIESGIEDAQADTPFGTVCASTFATACTSGSTSCTSTSCTSAE